MTTHTDRIRIHIAYNRGIIEAARGKPLSDRFISPEMRHAYRIGWHDYHANRSKPESKPVAPVTAEPRNVTLRDVRGAGDEFADLIGFRGKLMAREGGFTFLPADCGDILTLLVKDTLPAPDGWLRFRTKLGNVFTFAP